MNLSENREKKNSTNGSNPGNQYLDQAEGTICGGLFPKIYRGQICNLAKGSMFRWRRQQQTTFNKKSLGVSKLLNSAISGVNPLQNFTHELLLKFLRILNHEIRLLFNIQNHLIKIPFLFVSQANFHRQLSVWCGCGKFLDFQGVKVFLGNQTRGSFTLPKLGGGIEVLILLGELCYHIPPFPPQEICIFFVWKPE